MSVSFSSSNKTQSQIEIGCVFNIIHHHKLLRIAQFIFFRQRTGKFVFFIVSQHSLIKLSLKITNCLIYIQRTYCSRYSYTNKNHYMYICRGEFQGNTCFTFKGKSHKTILFLPFVCVFCLNTGAEGGVSHNYLWVDLLTQAQSQDTPCFLIHSLLLSPFQSAFMGKH